MTQKRKPTVDDAYDRKQRTNADSQATTLDDITVFENARSAVALLKKTFETWVVIGKAVVRARDIATERGGGKTFMKLIEQEGLASIVNKTTASNLLRIMEQLGEVTKWHETLQPRQQVDWAAPTTILKRCPVFNKPDPEAEKEKPLSMAKQTEMALANALERVAELESREEGDRFKPTDTAQDIAVVLVGMFSQRKAKDIAERMLELLTKRAPKKPSLKDGQEGAREITG
jgi:hypothetical protein